MFIDILSSEPEYHRAELLADAENFRLARLVRQARRSRRNTPASDPPRRDRSGSTDARRNDDAERRYAVSR